MNLQISSNLPVNINPNSIFLIKDDPEYNIYAQNILTQSWLQWIFSWFRRDIKITIENASYHVKVRDIAQKLGITPNRVRETAKLKNSFTEFRKMAIIKKFDDLYPEIKYQLNLKQKETLAEILTTNEKGLINCLIKKNDRISIVVDLIKSNEEPKNIRKILTSEEFLKTSRILINGINYFEVNRKLYKSVVATKQRESISYNLVKAVQSSTIPNEYGIIQETIHHPENQIVFGLVLFSATQNLHLNRFLNDAKKLPIANTLIKTRNEAFKLFSGLFRKEKFLTRGFTKVDSTRYFLTDDRLFKTDQKIGSGAFGRIYRVVDMKSGTAYAIKRALKKIKQGNSRVGSLIPFNELKKEYESLRTIHQSARKIGIISPPLFNEQKSLTTPFMVLELYSGDITKACELFKKISVEKSLLLCRQLIQGLKTLHESNYVHCDIKPTNCLMKVNDHGEIVEFALGDFGGAINLANIKDGDDISISYTPHYRPSDWNSEFNFGRKARGWDVYALCKTILETLNGYLIGTDSSLVDALQRLEERKIPKDVLKTLIRGLHTYTTRPSAEQLLKDYDQALIAAGINIPREAVQKVTPLTAGPFSPRSLPPPGPVVDLKQMLPFLFQRGAPSLSLQRKNTPFLHPLPHAFWR